MVGVGGAERHDWEGDGGHGHVLVGRARLLGHVALHALGRLEQRQHEARQKNRQELELLQEVDRQIVRMVRILIE